VSEQTIYAWRKHLGGFQASDVRRLKQLKAENARLNPAFLRSDKGPEPAREAVSS
jgi:hypothetical protein